ncbi:MAG: sugar porter family MFS transporter [Candidatus Dormibacteraeota bacterium]|nr:sugar porter family MFS transporter [Candidatus Dormibacteraeota bacterium]
MRRFPFIEGVFKSGNRYVGGIALIAALGGFLFGYDTGVIGGALLYIKTDFHLDANQQQAVVASILAGAALGAIISGYLADKISRKWTKCLAGSIYVIGAIAASASQNYFELIAARFWLGLAVGCASFVAPMYIAEQVTAKMRGGMVSFNQLMIVSGILLAYISDWALKGVPGNWRWMFGIAAIPGLALAIGMVFVPHTPRWLASKGRDDEAREVLRRTRDREDVEDELEEIKAVAKQKAGLRDLLRPAIRPLLLVGVGLAIFQQVVGINTVIYYSPTILSFTGLQAGGALTQALFIGVTNVVFTIVAILLLDTLGRRFLLILGTVCLTIALVSLGFYFRLPYLQQHAHFLALFSLMFYIAGFAIGLGPVFWLLIAEIYPLRIRASAMAVATFFNWAFNFGVSYTFLTLIHYVTRAGAFWFYAFLGICALVFFWRFVPETKDRSLEQIEKAITGKGGVAELRPRRRARGKVAG